MRAGPLRAHREPRSGLRGPSSHRVATRQARGPQAQPWQPPRRTLLSCGDDGRVGSTPCGICPPCARARGPLPAHRRDAAGRAWTWSEPGALWAPRTQQTGAALPPSPRTGPCSTAAPARAPGAHHVLPPRLQQAHPAPPRSPPLWVCAATNPGPPPEAAPLRSSRRRLAWGSIPGDGAEPGTCLPQKASAGTPVLGAGF